MGNPSSATRIWSRQILNEQGVTDRCLRAWIARGKFPAPDGNLNGRNFWLLATYEKWKAAVLAGHYRQARRPNPSAQPAAA